LKAHDPRGDFNLSLLMHTVRGTKSLDVYAQRLSTTDRVLGISVLAHPVRFIVSSAAPGVDGLVYVSRQEIGTQVETLSKQYPLTIPPWFGLIVRTFSALEVRHGMMV
jgi:hypothetical protein